MCVQSKDQTNQWCGNSLNPTQSWKLIFKVRLQVNNQLGMLHYINFEFSRNYIDGIMHGRTQGYCYKMFTRAGTQVVAFDWLPVTGTLVVFDSTGHLHYFTDNNSVAG